MTSSRLTMCSRTRSGSRDMNQAAFYGRPHARLHGVRRQETHGSAEQRFEIQLQVHVAIERRRCGEFDEHADIRPPAPFAASGRPEERDRPDAESPLDLRDTVTQRAEYFCSVHTRVSPPAG